MFHVDVNANSLPPNDNYLRVNKSGRNMRRSTFDQVDVNDNALPQPPQVQVYIVDKSDFKSLVQRLTGPQACQNLPKRQKIRQEPINQTSSIPPSAMAVQEDPGVLRYMRYFQSALEDSSGPNGDQFQQPFDENQPNMLAQMHSQPQAPTQSMPQSNGFEPVYMSTTFPSSWFNGSSLEMHGSSSLQSTRVEYPQPLNPHFTPQPLNPHFTPQPPNPDFTFSSMTQPGVHGPNLDSFGLDEIFDAI